MQVKKPFVDSKGLTIYLLQSAKASFVRFHNSSLFPSGAIGRPVIFAEIGPPCL
jgi:hypothetical protein